MPWRGAGVLTGLALLLASAQAQAQQGQWGLRPVERVRNPLVGRADLGGRVFEDLDRDGRLGAEETGIEGVVVRLDDGRFVVTDSVGRYQFAEITPGQHTVSLARGTLPPGLIDPPGVAVLELPAGALRMLDFPLVIETEEVKVGQEEVRGHALFLNLRELPVNVVGNATDLQGLVNGARLAFPGVDIELTGFSRAGFQDAGKLARTGFQPNLITRRPPRSWELRIVDASGKVLRTRTGDGKPARRIPFDGKDDSGSPLPAPGAYTAQLCLEFAAGGRACSPVRSFGLTTGKGRKIKRPVLDLLRVEALAEINGRKAQLDADGSFISPVRLDPERREIQVRLRREDGREASASITLPLLVLDGPGAETRIAWGTSDDFLTAPEAPGKVQVRLRLKASGTTRAQVGDAPLPLKKNTLTHPMEVGSTEQRLELTAVGTEQVSTLYELRASVSDTRPDGEAIIEQAAVPELELQLPAPSATLGRPSVRLRGRTRPGNRIQVGSRTVAVGSDGRFDTLVEVPEGRLRMEVRDTEGGVGLVERQWTVRGGGLELGAFAEVAPFGRALFPTDSAQSVELRKGLGAAGRGFAIGSLRGGLRLWGGAGLQSQDRPLAREGEPAQAWGRADARLGAEGPVGERLAFAAGYQGAFFVGGEEGLPMQHALDGSFGLAGVAFDALADVGALYGARDDGSNYTLLGGGLGVRFRATESFDLRARVGARISLSGGSGEVLDAALQATYRLRSGFFGSVRYAHVEDNRDVEPEAAGDVAHLTLGLPLGQKASLSATAGAWLVRGAVTLLQSTRLELSLIPELLLALDFRLQSQLDLHEYLGQAEASYQPLPWMRLGLVYAYVAVTGGGEHSSRLQLRAQVIF